MQHTKAGVDRVVNQIPGVAEARDHNGALVRAIMRKIGRARVDAGAAFEFVMKEETTRERIRLLPHQRLVFDFVEHYPRSVIRMPVGFSKCVAEGTEVVDPITGIPIPVEHAIYEVKDLWTWSKGRGIHVAPVTASHDMGTKETIALTLRSGREIVVTPEHPMLSPSGWIKAEEILPGMTLGSPVITPEPLRPRRMDPHSVFLLALLMSEGNTTQAVRFSTADPEIVRRAVEASNSVGCDVRHIGRYDYQIKGLEWRTNAVLDLVRDWGIMGKLSKDKQLPKIVFQLSRHQLSDFLAVFVMCDGFVSRGFVGITLANESLVRALQHLFLRLGISSSVHPQPSRFGGKTFPAWALRIEASSLEAVRTWLAPRMWGRKRERLLKLADRKRNPNVGIPALSNEQAARLRSEGFGESFTKGGGLSPSRFPGEVVKRGKEREYGWIFGSGIRWDQVVGVRPGGVRRVFDFTMNPTACFIANDLIVHNTYTMGFLSMFMLGQDPTTRGAIVSATQGQAEKPFSLVRDYIERSEELRALFPNLRPSQRTCDHWTQTKIVVERPPGIRDPSLVAVGVDGSLPGSRLNWILVDDILDVQNTSTIASREKVAKWFATTVLSRRDVRGSKIVICNTPWVAPSATDDGDLTYQLEKAGWPTLTMNAEGGIFFTNADDFDVDYIRPSQRNAWGPMEHRLIEHDEPTVIASSYAPNDPPNASFDTEEVVPLWPEKFDRAALARLRDDFSPLEYAQLFLMVCQDATGGKVQTAWIEQAKDLAISLGHFGFKADWTRPEPTYTGVDLGVGKGARSDFTALFTFAVVENRKRLILDIEFGRFRGRQIVDKIIDRHQRFGSIVRVENNAAQDFILQWARDQDVSVPLRAHTTGKNKADPRHGVESIFIELENGAWIIPCAPGGVTPKAVQQWINEMVTYSPEKHTGDILMASWLAREQARRSGAFAEIGNDYSSGLLTR